MAKTKDKKMKNEAKTEAVQPVREPVTERGTELLKRLYQEGGLYLTREEGEEIVQAGHAQVLDFSKKNEYGPFITISDLGLAQLGINAKGNSVMDTNTKPKFKVTDYCPPIAKKSRGAKRGSSYPFDLLQVNHSFHVPVSAKMPEPVKTLASAVTVANRRFSVGKVDANGNPVMETVKQKVYAKGADGKRAKAEDGSLIVQEVKTVQRQEMQQTRTFVVQAAVEGDPEGPGARVIRTA